MDNAKKGVIMSFLLICTALFRSRLCRIAIVAKISYQYSLRGIASEFKKKKLGSNLAVIMNVIMIISNLTPGRINRAAFEILSLMDARLSGVTFVNWVMGQFDT